MKITISNNHITFSVETNVGPKIVILDTGYLGDSVFCDDDVSSYSFNGKSFVVNRSFIAARTRSEVHWDDLSSIIGVNIDGIIGYGFVSENDIIIDVRNSELLTDAKPEGFTLHDVDVINRYPFIEVKIQGNLSKVMFNTGVMYSVVISSMTNLLTRLDQQIEDYNPYLGVTDAELYQGDIEIGGIAINNANIAVARFYDKAIEQMNLMTNDIVGILGLNTILDTSIYLSCQTKKIGIKK